MILDGCDRQSEKEDTYPWLIQLQTLASRAVLVQTDVLLKQSKQAISTKSTLISASTAALVQTTAP